MEWPLELQCDQFWSEQILYRYTTGMTHSDNDMHAKHIETMWRPNFYVTIVYYFLKMEITQIPIRSMMRNKLCYSHLINYYPTSKIIRRLYMIRHGKIPKTLLYRVLCIICNHFCFGKKFCVNIRVCEDMGKYLGNTY